MGRCLRCLVLVVVLVLVASVMVGTTPLAAESRSGPRSLLGPTIHVAGYPVGIANGRIVMGENYVGRIVLFSTKTGGRRVVHVPRMFSVLAASGDTAWVDAGTKHDDRAAIEQVNVVTGAVLGKIDLGDLESDIRAPDNQVVTSASGVWLLSSGDQSPVSHLLRLDQGSTTIAARQDLPSGFDSLGVAGPNVWISGQDTSGDHSLLRAFDPATLAPGLARSFDIQSVDVSNIVGDEHTLWSVDGQELLALDAVTGQLTRRTPLTHLLGSRTNVDAVALRGDVVWITVSRKLHDDPTPPDHVELIALRASDGHVLRRLSIPGAGKDVSPPQLVTGDGEIWVWLGGEMEQIVADPH